MKVKRKFVLRAVPFVEAGRAVYSRYCIPFNLNFFFVK